MKKGFITMAKMAFVMILAIFTTTNSWAYRGSLTGDGSNVNPYYIMDLDDWNTFTSLLNDATYAPYYVDKHYRLGADIGEAYATSPHATTWAANLKDYPFTGSFDGQGHTIYIDFTQYADKLNAKDATEQGVALFHYVSNGCDIHDLIVHGTIHTDYKYAAGIISYIKAGSPQGVHFVNVSRCTSEVQVTLGITGDATSGGLIAYSGDYVYLTVNDCLFSGSYIGPDASHCSGIVGFQSPDGFTYIKNCYVNPYNVYLVADENHNLCRYDYDDSFDYNNCYYSASFGDTQGEFVGFTPSTEWLAAMLGYWRVVNDTPVPLTINMVDEYCTLFTGFSAYDYWTPYNTNTYFGDEGYAKIVDGDKQSKWCVSYPYDLHNEWEPIEVEFECGRSFVPKGYIITTGNDTKDHTDRRPKEWQVMGYNETTGYWDILDHRVATGASNILPEASMTDMTFLMSDYANITTDYKRFAFKVIDIWREDEYWDGFFHGWKTNTDDFVCEVGELQLFGVMSNTDLHNLENCAISGMLPYYDYTGTEIPLHYIVTDYHNDELVEYTHYTKNIVWKYGTQTVDHVTEVNAPGEYTMTINGMSGYTGSKSYSFIVMSDELPTPMAWTNDNGSAFYYVKMPKVGMTTLDLTETDPDFTHQFYVFSDNGYNQSYSPYCNGQLHIKAPDGYLLQLQGEILCHGYPNDYLIIYDGADINSPVLGDDHYGVDYREDIPLLFTTGPDLLLYFQSDGFASSLTGVNISVTPVSASLGYDIDIADVEHGELTAAQTTGITVCTEVTLNVDSDDGYMLQDVAVKTSDGTDVSSDNGLWYTGKNTVTFNMPASDVEVTPTFAALNDLSVNMPANSSDLDHAENAYIPADVTTFKVYDCGGAAGVCTSNSCELLLLTAPANTVFEFSGSVNLYDDGSYFEIYNGDGFGGPIGWYDHYNNTIDKELSIGNQALLMLVTEMNSAPGIDLTVRVVNKNDEFNIGINNVTGGTVAVDGEAKARVYDEVTLDVTVEDNYLITEYSMTPDCHMPVKGGVWHESPTEATFTMPAENIVITPTITDDLSADGGLYINMPESNKYDYKVVNIPSGVSSFKVYDDGGPNGNYSMYCDGYLVLTAPFGYRLKLSGNVTCNDKGNPHDYLKVYDGDTVTAAPLGNPDGFGYNAGLDFGPLTSSGRSMLLNFYTSGNSMAGLDLTVEVSNEEFPYIIEFDNSQAPEDCGIAISGYESVSNNHYVAHVGNTITLTVTLDDNHYLTAFTLKDADGNDIPMSGGLCWFDGNNSSATFTMPARNLFITYGFAEKGNQYIKLPKQNGVQTVFEVIPPDGITSFKVYDDGGLNGNYSDNCDSYTLLTAPDGKAWKLTGTVTTEDGNDFLIPYDGNSMGTRIDGVSYGKSSGQDIGTLVTTTNQVFIFFSSNYSVNYSGVNLTATIIDPITKTVEGYANVAPGQDRWVFIAGPLKNGKTPAYVENLFPEGDYGEPLVTSPEYDLYRYNQSADAEWENYKMHSGDFSIDGGRGYLYASKYARTLYFGGSVNPENSKEVPLSYDANADLPGWNLVGNPLMVSAYLDRPYYQINEFGNDIEAVDAYTYMPVPVGTGALVCAEGANETVTFSKNAPSSKAEGNGSIKMTLSKAGTRGVEYQDNAIVSFDEGVKLGKYVFNKDHAKIYIAQDDNDYAIACAKREGEVPLCFKTKTTGRYTITVETCRGASLQGVQLVDKFEDVTVNLSSNNSYTFVGSAADGQDRFKLVFGEASVSGNFAYQNGSDIIISGEGELQIFDVMGRMIMQKRIDGVETIAKPSQTGVYIMKLNENIQKIVIE